MQAQRRRKSIVPVQQAAESSDWSGAVRTFSLRFNDSFDLPQGRTREASANHVN
ncbi:hypothetical protein DFP91_4222 [Pseudorhodoplanes sinuspersici]|nr:hypothetical protein DFP91_4222 [Pseudorhodoplanes sinuspersici]